MEALDEPVAPVPLVVVGPAVIVLELLTSDVVKPDWVPVLVALLVFKLVLVLVVAPAVFVLVPAVLVPAVLVLAVLVLAVSVLTVAVPVAVAVPDPL